MDNGKISVRYARALLLTANEQHCETAVYEGLSRLVEQYRQAINAFNEALSNPINGKEEKQQLLLTAIGEPVHPCLASFIDFLTEKRRENKIFLIALKYQEMYRKQHNIIHAEVTTATVLNDSTLAKIKDFVEQTFSCTAEITVHVNPDLIGGFTLDIGHERMDASIVGQLNKLKKELQL